LKRELSHDIAEILLKRELSHDIAEILLKRELSHDIAEILLKRDLSHDIAEILLKRELSTISITLMFFIMYMTDMGENVPTITLFEFWYWWRSDTTCFMESRKW
jgi:uncharacterized membrane protein